MSSDDHAAFRLSLWDAVQYANGADGYDAS